MNKVLFWDFDGTLVIPNEAFTWALWKALQHFGYEMPFEKVRPCINKVIPWHTNDSVYPQKTGMMWWDDVYVRAVPFYEEYGVRKNDYDNINKQFRKKMLEYSHTLYSDADEVLAKCLKIGYTKCILSNNYPELPEMIGALGLGKYFSDYFVSSHIGYDKPRSEIFMYAAEKNGNPDIMYMIGDNYTADIMGASAAGLRTIFVPRTPFDKQNCHADHICENLSEIPKVLE